MKKFKEKQENREAALKELSYLYKKGFKEWVETGNEESVPESWDDPEYTDPFELAQGFAEYRIKTAKEIENGILPLIKQIEDEINKTTVNYPVDVGTPDIISPSTPFVYYGAIDVSQDYCQLPTTKVVGLCGSNSE